MRVKVKTVTTKSGKEVVFREPRESDAQEMMEYINELVDEDVMIIMNEKQTLAQEQEYVRKTVSALEQKNKVCLLAMNEEKVVGISQIERDRGKLNHTGTFGISIKQDCRGDGVGRQLAQAVMKLAENEMGLEVIKLTVFEINQPARELYRKLGFVESGAIPRGIKYRGEYVKQIIMVKELNKEQ